MDTFLPPSAFAGSWMNHAATRPATLTEAEFNGHLVVSNWQREEVQRLLPPNIEPCINTSATADLHPVVFLFGDLTGGAMRFGGMTMSTPVNYRELGICVPFVKGRADSDIHTYMLRMYSSYDVATWNGNFHYGFSKQIARLWWQGPLFMVTTQDDRLLLHATVEPTGEWLDAEACAPPNFAALRAIFSAPVIGRKNTGAYVCSYFGWDFSAAQVRAADACVSIDAPFVDGLSPRQCFDVSGGTFEVRGMIWRLSWPMPCRFA